MTLDFPTQRHYVSMLPWLNGARLTTVAFAVYMACVHPNLHITQMR